MLNEKMTALMPSAPTDEEQPLNSDIIISDQPEKSKTEVFTDDENRMLGKLRHRLSEYLESIGVKDADSDSILRTAAVAFQRTCFR